MWVERASELGMRFRPMEGKLRSDLEPVGLRPGAVAKALCPGLASNVEAIDFNGFPVSTHADVPDEQVRAACENPEARRDRIPWEGDRPLPLERMCIDKAEGPKGVPLHPGGEAYWRERRYL